MNLHITVTSGWYKNVIEWMNVNGKHWEIFIQKIWVSKSENDKTNQMQISLQKFCVEYSLSSYRLKIVCPIALAYSFNLPNSVWDLDLEQRLISDSGIIE